MLSKSQAPTYKATALAQLVSAAEASGQVLAPEEQQTHHEQLPADRPDRPVSTRSAPQPRRSHDPPSEFASHVSVNPETDTAVFDVSGALGTPRTGRRLCKRLRERASRPTSNSCRQRSARLRSAASSSRSNTAEAGISPTTSALQATQLREQVHVLQGKISEAVASPSDTIRVLGSAPPPTSPSSPQAQAQRDPGADQPLCCWAAVRSSPTRCFTDRYRDADEVAADLGLPLLGEMPRAALHEQPAIEAFRRLRTAMVFELSGRRERKAGAVVTATAVPRTGSAARPC